MSRIGRKPIAIPANVNVTVDGNKVTVAGPKGTLDSTFHAKMAIAVEGGNVVVSRPDDTNESKALHGLTRTLISNMVTGVSEGFTKDLEVIGVGYRVAKQGTNLVMNLGYSHPVIFEEGDGGSKWWGQRIDWLNRISGNRDENLKPFVVEICPWHSKKWGRLDYNNNELVKTIEENTLNPAFYAVQNAKISNCVIAIGKDYCEVLSELGFKEEVRFMPSSGNLEVFVNGSKDLKRGTYWSVYERWPRNKKQELSNRAFTVFSKGENRILCIWSNKGGSNKPPQEGFDTLVKALIEGSY